ncbi:MAG: Protein-L-isoaspartate O-methyltransferase [bacterium]|nr:Protein-L-isoaspartate O-methyltransferase [bacterium]
MRAKTSLRQISNLTAIFLVGASLVFPGCSDQSGTAPIARSDGRATPVLASSAPAPAEVTSSTSAGNIGSGSPEWIRPRSEERKAERLEMVRTQIEGRGVSDPKTLEAMRNVPRHWFVPDSESSDAYSDSPLPIGRGQTISQPYIVALMTQALALSDSDKVLEVGTGSGYQAAVLAEITPHVWSIEIEEALAARAAKTLEARGYSTVRVRAGDGYLGWPEAAPFDAIIVTCAPNRIPQPLIDQLRPGGRICIPVGETGGIQHLVLVTKTPEGALSSRTLELVRFVPMMGISQKE